jgi:hypothetical protein
MAQELYHLNVCTVSVLERGGVFGTFPHLFAEDVEEYVHTLLRYGFGDGDGDKPHVKDGSHKDMQRMLSAACVKYNTDARMLHIIRGDYEDVVDRDDETLYKNCSLAEATELMTRGTWTDGDLIMRWELSTTLVQEKKPATESQYLLPRIVLSSRAHGLLFC